MTFKYFITILLCSSTLAWAQPKTIKELRDTLKGRMEQKSNPTLKEELNRKNDGNPTFADRLGGTVSNFEQIFQGLIEIEPEEDGKALAARWNSPKSFANGSLGLAVIAREPTLYESLESSLTENQRADLISDLRERLRDDDDLTFSLSWNLENKRFGRKHYLEDKDLLSNLLGEIFLDSKQTAYTFDPSHEMKSISKVYELIFIKDRMFGDWLIHIQEPLRNIDDIELKFFTPVGLNYVETQLTREIKSDQALLANFEKSLADAHFLKIADRLYNQPQFNFTLKYRKTDNLVSPNRFGLKLNFEKGFGNLNQLRSDLADLGKDVTNLQTFKESIDNPSTYLNRRLAFSLEYERTEAYDNTFLLTDGLSEDQFTLLQTEAFDVTKAKLTYGQNIALNSDGSNPYRLDLSAEFQSFPDEAMQPDKFVASLTLTSLLTDKITAPISLVYSNHEMYLGEVDEQFSINFGIKFGVD